MTNYNPDNTATIWDKKAESYARFSNDENSFYAKILKKIQTRAIFFDAKTVLDIGCGTGVYTLHIAKLSSHITALDFSKEMLDILIKDAKKEQLLSKITPICSAWEDFSSDKLFDITFSSMSPAFKSDEDFEKMHALAKEHCVYLGWGGKRESLILTEVFQAHGKTLKSPMGSEKLKTWLEKKYISYECDYIEDEWNTPKKEEEAIKSVLWHLEINEVNADIELVKKIIHAKVDALGWVNFNVKVGLELISWAK